MGVGFGYLAEYHESIVYFEKELKENPDSVVIKTIKNLSKK